MLNPEWDWRGWVRVIRRVHRWSCDEVRGWGPCSCEPAIVDVIKANLIVTEGKNLMRDAMIGVESTPKVKYVAAGSDNAGPALGNTALGAEFFRKIVTRYSNAGAGDGLSTCYIAPIEANTPKIEELGWFGGATATGTAGSGRLIARVLYSHQKTAQESLQIDRHDTF